MTRWLKWARPGEQYETTSHLQLVPRIVMPYPIQAVILPAEKQAADVLAAWQRVYDGLSDADVTEVETIALEREHFMPQRG